jgi:hypothetical protein
VIFKLNEEFIFGGYFIVVPKLGLDYQNNKLVPENPISISEEICDIVPGTWALSWVENREKDIARIIDMLKINLAEFLELEKWVTKEFEKGILGWQYGFSELTKAKEFAELFLNGISEYRILSIGLAKSETKLFLESEAPHDNMGSTLVYDTLSKGKELNTINLLGFDLLGYDLGGFYSYLSDGLEKYLNSEFDIVPNKYGFYDAYELLLKGAKRISVGAVDAEPALWQPWAICLEETMLRN